MIKLNKETVVVFSYEELKEVLENENEYSYIYLGDNIVLSGGIGISNSKTNVVIDGTYEYTRYEFTVQKKLGSKDGIYLSANKTSKVIVKNMKITGYNYYGVIYVPENSLYSNVEIEYINIEYEGPQLSYNPVGLTRILNSIITINKNYADGNEVAECNKIEIGGFTTIIHKSTANSAFWFRNANPFFTILTGATVYFTSVSRELFYGTNELNFSINKGAYFFVTSNNGLAYGTYGTKLTLIDENAYLSITKTGYNGTYATWYSYGDITVEKGATLKIINDYENITNLNYNIYFSGTGAGIILNNPYQIVLYNKIANVIYSKSEAVFEMSFSRINLFDKAINIIEDISEENLPTYSWYKEEGISEISGTFTNSETSVLDNNYTEEELENLPDINNFNIHNKKIISIGTFSFVVAPLTDTDIALSGKTESYASILIKYENITGYIKADENGEFSYNFDTPLKVGTVITFICKLYENVIYYTKKIEIVYSGELKIESATKYFEFDLYAISKSPVICPKLNALVVNVVDSRINSSDWKLYASVNHDLETEDGKVLENSIIFLDESGKIEVLSKTPTLVYTGKNNEGKILKTSVTFEEEKGILLQVLEPLENNTSYFADIIWTIEE